MHKIWEGLYVGMTRTILSVLFLLTSAGMFGQKKTSPFNTIGGERHPIRMLGFAKELPVDSLDIDDDDDYTDADSIQNVSADSIREFVPAVSLPLKSVRVSSPFGMRRDPMNRKKMRMHNGLDLKAHYEEVFSMLPGIVTATGSSKNGGNFVTVNHGVCVCSYLHLSKILVKKGAHVNAGQAVAISGNTGKRTTGPHLHIACRLGNEKGKFFNPEVILSFVKENLLANSVP